MWTIALRPTTVSASARVGMVSSVPARRIRRRSSAVWSAIAPVEPGHPLQAGVVENHGFAIGGELDIQFDAVAARRRRPGKRPGNSPGESLGRPQAAMGDGRREKPLPGVAEDLLHETSMTASTSTAKFRGRR